MTALIALSAVLLDGWLGEPKRWHPLVGFGRLAQHVERMLRGAGDVAPRARRWRGIAAWWVLIFPLTTITAALCALPGAGMVCSVAALYFALGHRSLHDHARPVAEALRTGDDATARARVSLMVSRDSAALDVENAATESVLENGNDGVFGALFWFAVAGGAGAVLYRLANTLDAMWGYRNEKYRYFGWAAARFDDALNYSKERYAFGRPIGQFQAIQGYISAMATEIELARLITYKAAWLQSNNVDCSLEASMAKMFASDCAVRATDMGMRIMAGYGFTMEYDMQRYFRDARQYVFAPITNEMSKNFIAEKFGLPKSY